MRWQLGNRPANITVNKEEQFLEITWDDGLISHYPLPQLREACPCVECRGGHSNMGQAFEPDNLLTLKPKLSSNAYQVNDAHLVGNYALQLAWADGHDTGIYTWDMLRRLSPETEDIRSRED